MKSHKTQAAAGCKPASAAHAAPACAARAGFVRGAARVIVAAAAAALGGPGSARAAAPVMHRRAIPSSGALLPVIGCGTWRTFDVGDAPEAHARIAQVLQVLFDAGGTVVDTSPMYGSSEQVLGATLPAAGGRARAFVATKVWTSGRDAGIAQMRESMRKLGTDRVDLMQVHNLVDWRTHLATLRDWKRDGRIGYLGLTHYTPAAHDELAAILQAHPVDFLQIDYSAADRAAERRLLPLAAERGVAVLVNQPFGGGALLRTLAGKPLPAWAAEIGCASWAQVLLKFVLSHPAVTCAIPGSGRPEHMRDNAAAGFGILPDAAMRERIAQAAA